jgi:hypothetical protein
VTVIGPPGVGGYCPHCGMAYGLVHGPFCRRCGNPVRPVLAGAAPAAASTYAYPVVASNAVPAAQHRLGKSKLLIVGALGLAALVVVISAAATVFLPSVSYCHFDCGPVLGPRLLSATFYQSRAYGYRVEYNSSEFGIQTQTASQVDFEGNAGLLRFSAAPGSDPASALSGAISGLPTSTFQDIQMTSADIPGAEIGLVLGSGQVYSATYVPPGGGSSFPVVVAVIAATQGNLTITTLAVSEQDLQGAFFPLGLAGGFQFDYSVTNTIWPGAISQKTSSAVSA